MEKKRIYINIGMVSIFFIALIYFCCQDNSQDNNGYNVHNDKGFTKEGTKNISEGINQFSFSIFREIEKDKKGNIFISPLSIEIALSIAHEGAASDTRKEMEKALYLISDNESRRSNIAHIINVLNNNSDDYILEIANAIWIDKGYPIKDNYIKIVKQYYGSEVRKLVSEKEINKWVSEKTHGKIKKIIDSIPPLTKIIITNAIYFKGEWDKKFDKAEDDDFWINSTKKTKVKMMFNSGSFNYAENEKYQVLELPYKGKNIAMIIFLPKNKTQNIKLSLREYKNLTNKLYKEENVQVYLPKFEMKEEYTLNDYLKALGIRKAFDPKEADFSYISDLAKKRGLHIYNVLHKTYIKVNESGTEAAASTGIIMIECTKAPQPKITIFRADHPFLFFIVDKRTDTILFMGKVVNPNQS